MDVSVVIVNYNSDVLASQCIRSLHTHVAGIAYEIIVVDNASRGNSAESLVKAFPEVRLIRLPENIGFGRANNVGIKAARGKYVLLLNPDTILLDNALLSFFRFMEQPENERVGVCGGALIDAAGAPGMSYGNFPSLLGNVMSIGFHLLAKKYYAEKLDTGVVGTGKDIRTVDYISGAAFFARKTLLESVGGFDDAFFLYFEETELCWKIRKKGYEIVFLPFVTIIHLEGGVTGELKTGSLNQFSFYHFYRSKRLFYKKTRRYLPSFIYYGFDILHEMNKSLFRGELSDIRIKFRLMTRPV